MSDRYQSLIQTNVGQRLAKSLGLPNPVPLERYTAGDPLVKGTVLTGGKGRFSRSLPAAPRQARRHPRQGGRRRQPLQGPGLRRDRHREHRPAGLAPGVLHPADAAPGEVPARHRPRYAAGAADRRRPRCAARPRGLHPLPRQGDRPRRHRPARLCRTEGGSRRCFDPRLPVVPQVRLRQRTGDPHRGEGRRHQGQDCRLGPAAERQGRRRHRRKPRHRRADRPGPAPRRRHRRRNRRAAGRERARGGHEGDRRRVAHPRHHRPRRGCPHQPVPPRQPRRRRRRRPQRRHHPRPQARQHEGRWLRRRHLR